MAKNPQDPRELESLWPPKRLVIGLSAAFVVAILAGLLGLSLGPKNQQEKPRIAAILCVSPLLHFERVDITVYSYAPCASEGRR